MKLPPDVQDAAILPQMSVPSLLVPEEEDFKPVVRLEELDDKWTQKDIAFLKSISKIEQWNDWQTEVLELQNRQLRCLEAEMIKRKTMLTELKEAQKEQKWAFSFGKWALTVLTASFCAGLFKWLFDVVTK